MDWEQPVAKNVRKHILVNERSHGMKKIYEFYWWNFFLLGSEEKFNYMISSNDEKQSSSETDPNDDLDASIDSLSQHNGNGPSGKAWNEDTAEARVERLQSNDVSEDVERQKRRNDALFLGNFSFFPRRSDL